VNSYLCHHLAFGKQTVTHCQIQPKILFGALENEPTPQGVGDRASVEINPSHEVVGFFTCIEFGHNKSHGRSISLCKGAVLIVVGS
jgi:hypothetical protein